MKFTSMQHNLTRAQYSEIRKAFAPLRKKVKEAMDHQKDKKVTGAEALEQVKRSLKTKNKEI